MQCKKEREKNEELLIKLVEQVIQKLKTETLESDFWWLLWLKQFSKFNIILKDYLIEYFKI